MNFDVAFQEIGVGITQHFATLYLSFVAFVEGLLTSAAFFLSPYQSCEFKVPWGETHLYTFFLFGYLVGTFTWGAYSDVRGRHFALTLASILAFAMAVAVTGTPTVFSFQLALLMLGFTLAGVHSGCRILLFECVPMRSRGRYTIIMDLITNIGMLFTLVWGGYMTSEVGAFWFFPPFRHWRLLYFVAALICLFGCLLIKLTFYSPRQLLAHQRTVSVIILIRKMFSLNHCKHEASFKVPCIEPFARVETRMFHRSHWSSYFIFCCQCVASYVLDVFCCPHTLVTIITLFLNFTIFDSVVLMNGLLSQRLVNGAGFNMTLGLPLNETVVKQLCKSAEPSIYGENIYLAIAAVFSIGLLLFLIDLCSRVVIIVTSSSICGISALIFLLDQSYAIALTNALFFVVFHSAIVATLQVVILEMYPTKFRSTAYGLVKIVARCTMLGVVFVPKIPSSHTFGYISKFMFVTSVLSLALRNKNRMPIDE